MAADSECEGAKELTEFALKSISRIGVWFSWATQRWRVGIASRASVTCTPPATSEPRVRTERDGPCEGGAAHSALPPQVSRATGYFELQLISVANPGGQLLNGDCCDAEKSAAEGPCGADECDTYFKVCVKEYQTEVATRGTCTYGSETTKVLGGNTFQFKSGATRNDAGKILIPFQFAWPVSGSRRSDAQLTRDSCD